MIVALGGTVISFVLALLIGLQSRNVAFHVVQGLLHDFHPRQYFRIHLRNLFVRILLQFRRLTFRNRGRYAGLGQLNRQCGHSRIDLLGVGLEILFRGEEQTLNNMGWCGESSTRRASIVDLNPFGDAISMKRMPTFQSGHGILIHVAETNRACAIGACHIDQMGYRLS